MVARSGADFAVNTLAGYAFETSREHWPGYIYTDRPVYRPGHTVHFKGILRQRARRRVHCAGGQGARGGDQGSRAEAGLPEDAHGHANGTIHDDLELPAGAALGNYSIEVQAGDENFMNGNFEVEEYKKPEYEVRVTPSKRACCKARRCRPPSMRATTSASR